MLQLAPRSLGSQQGILDILGLGLNPLSTSMPGTLCAVNGTSGPLRLSWPHPWLRPPPLLAALLFTCLSELRPIIFCPASPLHAGAQARHPGAILSTPASMLLFLPTPVHMSPHVSPGPSSHCFIAFRMKSPLCWGLQGSQVLQTTPLPSFSRFPLGPASVKLSGLLCSAPHFAHRSTYPPPLPRDFPFCAPSWMPEMWFLRGEDGPFPPPHLPKAHCGL